MTEHTQQKFYCLSHFWLHSSVAFSTLHCWVARKDSLLNYTFFFFFFNLRRVSLNSLKGMSSAELPRCAGHCPELWEHGRTRELGLGDCFCPSRPGPTRNPGCSLAPGSHSVSALSPHSERSSSLLGSSAPVCSDNVWNHCTIICFSAFLFSSFFSFSF